LIDGTHRQRGGGEQYKGQPAAASFWPTARRILALRRGQPPSSILLRFAGDQELAAPVRRSARPAAHWRQRRVSRRAFRHDSKSDWISFSEAPLALSRQPISALNFSNSSCFKSTGSAPSGEGKKTPAIRPRRVMSIGSLDRSNSVAWSRNSRTVLILIWSPW
jgi:hypothetical protein